MIELWIAAARGFRLNWDHFEFDQLRLLGQPAVDSTAQSTRRVIKECQCRHGLSLLHGRESVGINRRWTVAQRSPAAHAAEDRSEERRVGKECRSRWSPYH